MDNIFQDFRPPISTIISRSLVTASFNTEDRFEYDPSTGFKVKIPDRLAYVSFERATSAELRDRVAFSSDPSRNDHRQLRPGLPARSVAWWFAQLLHYGLPITPDQNQAQLSIKSAISRNQLIVPYRLRELENRLKRQYEVHSAKADIDDGRLDDQYGTSSNQQHRSTRVVSNQQTVADTTILNRRSAPFRAVSQSRFDNHTADGSHQSMQIAFNDQADRSDSDTSSSPDKDPTPKPCDLFTPNGMLVTMPAEFPGIHTKEEIEARRQVHQKKIEEYRLNHNKSRAPTPSKAKIPVTTSDDTVTAESSSDAVGEGLDGENQLVENLSSYLSERQQSVPIQTGRSRRNYMTASLESDDGVGECDEDDVESLIFYTPMQFVKRHRHEEDLEDDEDDESVILYDVKPKLEKKSRSRNAQPSNNTDLKKNSSLKSTNVRQRKSIPESKNKIVGNPSISRINKSSQKSTTNRTARSKKVDSKRSELSAQSRSSIWISSESENDDTDSDEDEVVTTTKSQKQSHHTEPLDENRRQRSRSTSKRLIPSLKALADTMTPTKRMLPPLPPDKTAATAKMSDFSLELRANGSGRKNQVPQPNMVQNLASSVNTVTDLDNTQEEQNRKSRRHRRKASRAASVARIQNPPQSSMMVVKDFTGCGITEMSGALHRRETESMAPPTSLVKSKKVEAVKTNPSSNPVLIPKRSARLPLSPEPVDTDIDGPSDVPSMRGLFSSQETPANWKLANRRSSSKDVNTTSKPQGTNPPHHQTDKLASLPAYLVTSALNNSPELSKSSPIRPMTKLPTTDTTTTTMNPRKRIRSMSAAPHPQPAKRSRPNMIEIEAENTSTSRRQSSMSMSTPHPEQIANIAQVFRTCDEIPTAAPAQMQTQNHNQDQNQNQRRLKRARAPAGAKGELRRKVSALSQEMKSAKKGCRVDVDVDVGASGENGNGDENESEGRVEYEEPHEKRTAKRKAKGEAGRKRNKA